MAGNTTNGRTFRPFILVFAALIFGYTIFQEFKPHYEVGDLEYRLVTGSQNDAFEVIMLETAKQYTVLNVDFKDIFENNDAEIISRPEQLQLLQKYKDLEYRVNIHKDISEGKAQYRLSRENFNKIKFNTKIKFEVDRKVKDSITSIVEL